MSDFTQLKRKRGSIKGRLTSFSNHFDTVLTKQSLTELEILELKDWLDNVLCLLEEFNVIQAEIEEVCDETDLPDQNSERDQFHKRFYEITCGAKLLLKSHDKSNTETASIMGSVAGSTIYHSASVKLPDISLPKFHGNFDDWLEFRDIFQSLIHESQTLSDIQKFFYLRGALEGSAAASIKRIQYNAANYTVAWETLCNRFNNTKKLLHDHLGALLFCDNIHKGSYEKLQHLADNISRHIAAIEQLGQSTQNWDCILIFWISQKLDNDTLCDWERQTRDKTESSTIDEFLTFLRERANFVDTLNYKCIQSKDKSNPKGHKETTKFIKRETTRSLVSSSQFQYLCSFCKGNHTIYTCKNFLQLSITDRIKFVKGNSSICVNCLREGHSVGKCKLGPCKKCKSRHNSLLHQDSENCNNDTDIQLIQPAVRSDIPIGEQKITFTGSASDISGQVLLSTANILILDKHNKHHRVRVLLDSGSQTSFISRNVFNKLDLPEESASLTIFGISNLQSEVNTKCKITLKSLHSKFKGEITCFILPIISNIMPSFKISSENLKIPSDLRLADSAFNIPGPVEMLIGADLFWHLLKSNKIILGKNLPILQDTELGWIVSGPFGITDIKQTSCHLNVNRELHQLLTKFWEVEEFSETKALSSDEVLCEQIFAETTKRQVNGRFLVNMPLKQKSEVLGESRKQAEKRFFALEKRLIKNPNFQTKYIDFMNEYNSLNHMNIVDTNQDESSCQYYMPHHGVLKESSLTTKLRVVFDASAPTSNGLSLNNIQLIGAVLQDDLLAIILRFRTYAYVVSADIAKMYRQVLINPEQRSLQRILWRDDPSQPLKTYELNTVTYGQASASFLSIRCLFSLADEIKENKPKIARVIKRDFYVDNLLTGADSIHELQTICREVSETLLKGCFELRQWCSNEIEILNGINSGSSLEYNILNFSENDNAQTLGLTWACHNDLLLFHINSDFSNKITKRSILSSTAKIFDPLGLLAPCIILAKMLIQKLWLEKISWDDHLPKHLEFVWLNFQNELPLLNNLKINRHVLIRNHLEVELHGFADSSEGAYGACIYLRSHDYENHIKVSLLCAKSKVAPLKTLSVPRLELCAALLLSRLTDKVLKSVNIPFSKCYLWSDSTITLAWIKTSPNLLQTFTANRVSEIQTLTKNCQWRYVPTGDNPADIVSRGLYPSQIIDCVLWWNGPSWLQCSAESWPNEKPKINNLPELKSQVMFTDTKNNFDFPFASFSKLSKLINVVAYLFRFRYNCLHRNERKIGCLNLDELNQALKILIKISQYQSFKSEIDDLLKENSINKKSSLSGLAPFLDIDNILRVGGRLKYSAYEFNKKHPILLHSKHHLTKLLFQREHLRLFHAGPQLLLNTIRNTYWPISGRNLARSTVKNCIRCFRFTAQQVQPLMGNLPQTRITPSSPFSVVGVDYAGPFFVRDRKGRGFKTNKCYIALFICFSTKAIHLEVVSSLSSDAFLQALHRFVSRRGKPSKIYSDNGSNFVGAQRELTKLFHSKSFNDGINNFSVSESIEWSFIPPYSPHFGGLWEAGVKSTKHHLKRVVSCTPLLFEEFYTFCTQIEAILNSRPLTPLSNDPNDLCPLTPSHFLIGRPMVAVPEETLTDLKMNKLSRYQLIQQMLQHFWKRWSSEYISELQKRTRWKQTKGQLKEGMLVLIKEDGCKPTQWRLGRIVKLHPGSDAIPRVATIKTSNGFMKRGYQRLCPLPIEN